MLWMEPAKVKPKGQHRVDVNGCASLHGLDGADEVINVELCRRGKCHCYLVNGRMSRGGMAAEADSESIPDPGQEEPHEALSGCQASALSCV